ncbi:sugar transferase [Rhizobium sullae]|uniref:Exopolysaccharide production protein ExoY n=1 Tax=Rhizobium sullae TaxID=50338 RepID=A0A4R3Q187_RHISU|nr:sugar transferase [Rhizobium sullae]TCU14798.1 exopolysaccharide production protein ExoY [Rhizobium sullae]
MKDFAWSRSRRLQHAQVVSQRTGDGLIKRGFDIAGALLALAFLSPLLLLLACLVVFADGGPVFQRHLRIGRGGCVFNCLRFRTTLEKTGGLAGAQFRPAALAAGANGTGAQAFEYDPHVTPVGALLTKLSLVEVPQLINILRGEMSIVGPRPIAPGDLKVPGNVAEFYLKSRPGLTGPWRLGASDEAPHSNQLKFERLYAENWSFLGDLHIISKCVAAACLPRGG